MTSRPRRETFKEWNRRMEREVTIWGKNWRWRKVKTKRLTGEQRLRIDTRGIIVGRRNIRAEPAFNPSDDRRARVGLSKNRVKRDRCCADEWRLMTRRACFCETNRGPCHSPWNHDAALTESRRGDSIPFSILSRR